MEASQYDSDKVAKHPLNNSPSKAQYSFPKSQRFGSMKALDCLIAAYDLPDTKSKRFTSFGYGKKMDFGTNHKINTPSPNAYYTNILERPKTKAFSFGIRAKAGGIFRGSDAEKNPGPGAYSIDDDGQRGKRSISLGSRTKYFVEINEERKNLLLPGPGAYQPKDTISSIGKYFISKYPSSRAGVFTPSESKRFNPNAYKTISPGPGAYNLRELSGEGRSFISKYESIKCGRFSSSVSRSDCFEKSIDHDTPGPGSYDLPSDFGYYLSSKVIKRTSQDFRIGNVSKPQTPGSARLRPRTSQEPYFVAKSTLDLTHKTPLRNSWQLSHHQSTVSTGDGNHRNSSAFEDKDTTKYEEQQQEQEKEQKHESL